MAKEQSQDVATTDRKPVQLHGAGGEVASVDPRQLRDLTLDEIQRVLNLPAVDAAEAVGTDQFGPVLDNENKGTLVGVPFVIVHWEFHDGDFGKFVSAWIVTQEPGGVSRKFILNDGSTGIFQQLQDVTAESGQDSMMACRHGLRRSDYTYTDANGNDRPATTFYIDTKL